MQNCEYDAHMQGLLPGVYDPERYQGGAAQGQKHDAPDGQMSKSEEPRVGSAPPDRPKSALKKAGVHPGLLTQKQYEAQLKERIEQVRREQPELYAPLANPTGRPGSRGRRLEPRDQPQQFENKEVVQAK